MAEAKKSAAKKTAMKKAPMKKSTVEAAAKKSVAKKVVPTKKPVASTKDPSYQQIAELAHRYWVERGGHHGSDKEDWLRAERELHAA